MSNTEATFADPERIALIESIAAKISSFMEANADITFRTTWACMWLANKECLRELSAHSYPGTRSATIMTRQVRNAVAQLVPTPK